MNTLTPEAGAGPEPVLDRRWRTRSFLAFAIAIAILAFFLTRLEVDPTSIVGAVRTADGGIVALAFLVYYLIFPIRALRWRLLLQNAHAGSEVPVSLPSILRMSRMIFLSWFANCVIPAKLGDAYRGYQIKQAANVSFAMAMGTIVAERLLDMAVLVVLLLVAASNLGGTALKENEFAVRVIEGGIGLLVVGAVALGAMWVVRDKLHLRLPSRLQARYLRFQEGTLGSFRNLAGVVPLSFTVWFGEASRLFLVTQAMHLGIPFPYAIFLSLANSLLTVVPFTPGGLGLVEAGIVGLLLLVGVDKDTAVATALVDRTISYWSIILLGLPVFLSRRRI